MTNLHQESDPRACLLLRYDLLHLDKISLQVTDSRHLGTILRQLNSCFLIQKLKERKTTDKYLKLCQTLK